MARDTSWFLKIRKRHKCEKTMRIFGSLACSILSVVQRVAMERLIPTNAKTARFFEELRDYWYRHSLGGFSFSLFLACIPQASVRALFGCRRFWDARRASFRYRTGCECGKIKLGEKLRRIGKAAEALIYDHRPTPYALAFHRIALPLHPWRLSIIERYCVTLPKLFHDRDTCNER